MIRIKSFKMFESEYVNSGSSNNKDIDKIAELINGIISKYDVKLDGKIQDYLLGKNQVSEMELAKSSVSLENNTYLKIDELESNKDNQAIRKAIVNMLSRVSIQVLSQSASNSDSEEYQKVLNMKDKIMKEIFSLIDSGASDYSIQQYIVNSLFSLALLSISFSSFKTGRYTNEDLINLKSKYTGSQKVCGPHSVSYDVDFVAYHIFKVITEDWGLQRLKFDDYQYNYSGTIIGQ